MNDLAGTDLWTLAVIVALGGVSVLTRCFFFISDGQGEAVLGTVVTGMAVCLPLHLAFGW